MAAVLIPSADATLRPSSATRWDNCAGSHTLELLYPEPEDSPAAREGTAAHFYVSETLAGREVTVGALAPNGHPIDAEMIAGGDMLVRDVRARLDGIADDVQFRVETPVRAHALIHPKCEGRPDIYALSLVSRRLIVWDFKYGHGFVDAFLNKEMLCYVAGICEENHLSAEDIASLTVSLRVVQPRNYHKDGPVRDWTVSGVLVLSMLADMRANAQAAKSADPACVTGPWCSHCSGRHACFAYAAVSARALDVAYECAPLDLPLDAVGRELTRIRVAADRLKARAAGLEAVALAAIESGKVVEGWRKDYVDSRERWRSDPAQVFALGDLVGVDLRDTSPVTPAAARAAFEAAGIPPETLAGHHFKPSGAAKLSPEDPNAAAKRFGAGTKPRKGTK